MTGQDPTELQGYKRAARLAEEKTRPSLGGTVGGRLSILAAEKDGAHSISTARLRWVTPGQAVTPGTQGWGQAVSVGARAEASNPVITLALSC